MEGPFLQFSMLLDAVEIVNPQNTDACCPEKLIFWIYNSKIILAELVRVRLIFYREVQAGRCRDIEPATCKPDMISEQHRGAAFRTS